MKNSSHEGMTREALEKLLTFLGAEGKDPAVGYERLRRRLVKILEFRAMDYRLRATPEDLADEAIGRVANQLEQGLVIRATDPFQYFYGVARRVVQEAARQEAKDGGLLDDDAPAVVLESEPDDEEPRHRCLDECLALLLPADRELILDFYREDRGQKRIVHRKRLAQRFGLTLNALRIKAHRVRHKHLGPCVSECLAPRRNEND